MLTEYSFKVTTLLGKNNFITNFQPFTILVASFKMKRLEKRLEESKQAHNEEYTGCLSKVVAAAGTSTFLYCVAAYSLLIISSPININSNINSLLVNCLMPSEIPKTQWLGNKQKLKV